MMEIGDCLDRAKGIALLLPLISPSENCHSVALTVTFLADLRVVSF